MKAVDGYWEPTWDPKGVALVSQVLAYQTTNLITILSRDQLAKPNESLLPRELDLAKGDKSRIGNESIKGCPFGKYVDVLVCDTEGKPVQRIVTPIFEQDIDQVSVLHLAEENVLVSKIHKAQPNEWSKSGNAKIWYAVQDSIVSAKERGDFVEAEGLNATLTGLKASVAEAREDIVSGKFRQEMGTLDAARHGLSTSTEQSMRRMEKEVNMQIEAKVADLERVHQTERAELEQLLQDKVRLEVLSFHTFRSTYLDFVTLFRG